MYFRRYSKLASAVLLLADILTICVCFVLAYAIRANWAQLPLVEDTEAVLGLSATIASLVEHVWLLLLIVPLWEGALLWSGAFKPARTSGLLDTAWTVVASVFLAAGAFGGLAFAIRLEFMSRGFIIVFVLLSAVALAFEKCLLITVLGEARRRDRNLISVLVVGTGARAQEYIADMRAHPEWGLRVLGLVDIERERVGTLVGGIEVIGQLDDIPVLLVNHVIDLVAFVVPRNWLGEIGESIRHCELQGVDVQVALDLFPHDIGRIRVTRQGRLPVLALEATSIHPWQAAVKRTLDIAVSATALVFLSPLFVVIAVVTKLSSPGPVFYRQVRNGLRGREFQMLKFRSMVHDADARLETLRGLNQMSGAAFKMANDPRVTPVGKFLRRFSLDELPQFINVLRGDMSLVGPRPLIATEKDKYEEWQRRRMSVRPGLTCLWQINGRNTVDFDHWMQLDLQYIDNWSILTDLKILAKTLPALMHGRGAY